MAMWNPWRGCHKYSEGCKFCYIHKGDSKRGIDTNNIVKSEKFTSPIEKNKKGEYKIKSGQIVYLCFSSDFLISEADDWREECWKMIKERSDLHFIFLTKRIERFANCIPNDWEDGYDNVTVSCTIENQENADYRLTIFQNLPIKHKNVICQPLIEEINIERYLEDVELVVVGGESDNNARPLDYDWVLSLRRQCVNTNTNFDFRQCGTNFIKDGKEYRLKVQQLCSQAKQAGINYHACIE
jgi:Bacteriophage protein gp37